MAQSIYDFSAIDMHGKNQPLSEFKGKVMLIVNTASFCGFTPQYKGLEALYKAYQKDGLVILGFPCNQFGFQEPRSNEKINDFCINRFDISFPLFEKIKVNGGEAHPLYQYLKAQAPGFLGFNSVKWNFTKFLVDKDGKVVGRYAPSIPPTSLGGDVRKLLGK